MKKWYTGKSDAPDISRPIRIVQGFTDYFNIDAKEDSELDLLTTAKIIISFVFPSLRKKGSTDFCPCN